MTKFYLLLLAGLAATSSLLAQQQGPEYLPRYFGAATLTAGRALFDPKHAMAGFEPQRGVNLKWAWETNGLSQQSRDLRKPYYGAGLHYSAYGRKSIYGYPKAAYLLAGFPLWRFGKWQSVLDGSIGIAWGFNPNHPETNPDNLAISSRGNIFFNANGLFERELGAGLLFSGGVGFSHYSNGLTRYPNLGVNLLHGVVGLKARFGKRDAAYFDTRLQAIDTLPGNPRSKFWGVYAALTAGWKQIKPLGENYRINSLFVETYYQYARIARVNFGVDYFYDPSLSFPRYFEPRRPVAAHRVGVHVGHDFLVGRVSMMQQIGFYVYEGYHSGEYFFFRLGGKVRITPHLYANATLMTFWINASMLELGLGFDLH